MDLAHCQGRVVVTPEDPVAWLRLASAHHDLAGAGPDHYAEAHLAFERALTMAPTMPAALLGFASSLYTLGQHEAARQVAKEAQQGGDYLDARIAEAGILLKLGRWQEGWTKHEARLERPDARTRPYKGTLRELRDKTVFVRGEQGYGDNLLFLRYVDALKPFCRGIILEAPDGMERLFRSFGHEVVSATDEMLGDAQISIMSLPFLLGDMIGWEPIRQPVTKWNGRGLGLCSASLAQGPTTRRKNPPWELFDGFPGVYLMYDGGDWLDTARKIRDLGLVISVDTAVAHLAATLGVETWLLQRFDSCWRWDEGWYSNVRIFQQPAPGDWEPVFNRVREALNTHTIA